MLNRDERREHANARIDRVAGGLSPTVIYSCVTAELPVIHPEQQIFGISAVIFRQRLLGESQIRST
jgi:hypothetical protein